MSRSLLPALRPLALLALPCCTGNAVAQTPSFHLVGFPSGTSASYVHGLSADGQVAAGFSLGNNSVQPGFTWSAAQGRYDLGLEGGSMPIMTETFAISGDGATVVGLAGVQGDFRAFRWSGSGTYQSLGVLGNYERSQARGISGDGSVIVGTSESGPSGIAAQATRWSASGGIQGLGFTQPTGGVHSEALGISRDGSTIVGYSEDAAGFDDAFVYTQGAGIHALPPPAGQTQARAFAANHDGSIIAGWSYSSNVVPTIWTSGHASLLGLPPGWTRGSAEAVNDDGTVVVGKLYNSIPSIAATWTLSRGAEPLADYLAAAGLTIPSGWTLWDCTSVSADGTVFGGVARTSSGQYQGFVATSPSPGCLPLLGVATAWATRRRRYNPVSED